MIGPPSDAYAQVWVDLYELAEGACVTVPELSARLVADLATIRRALVRAEGAGIVHIEDASHGGRGRQDLCSTWRRVPLPDPVTVEWAVSRGAPAGATWNVYRVLEARGLLMLTSSGFIRA